MRPTSDSLHWRGKINVGASNYFLSWSMCIHMPQLYMPLTIQHRHIIPSLKIRLGKHGQNTWKEKKNCSFAVEIPCPLLSRTPCSTRLIDGSVHFIVFFFWRKCCRHSFSLQLAGGEGVHFVDRTRHVWPKMSSRKRRRSSWRKREGQEEENNISVAHGMQMPSLWCYFLWR